MDKYNLFRNDYSVFIYDSYKYYEENDKFVITYKFIIKGLIEFNPTIKINKTTFKNKDIDKDFFDYLVFHIGLVEMISYYKATCSPKIIINAGYLNDEQIKWFKKLIYNGLGEFFYKNEITTTIEDLCEIVINNKEFKDYSKVQFTGKGNLIPVGGGKDSCVSMEILKNEDNYCFLMNAKTPSLSCAHISGHSDEQIIDVERNIDRKIVDLNNEGYLNGHTPFSALVAFISYLCAYISNRKNIILSNESSANEPTVINSSVNHQYSKSIEFENDFREYINKFFKIDINYFSLLRGLSEYQVGKLFSKYTKYHEAFKSCNLGSKNAEWKWCCNCPKCLFVYIILSPFLYKDDLIKIFGEDLFEREDLLETFKEIVGEKDVEPFECVGTINEANYAIKELLNKIDNDNLPILLKHYVDNVNFKPDEDKVLSYNKENNIPEYYQNLIEGELND